jgi:hypothetical protein
MASVRVHHKKQSNQSLRFSAKINYLKVLFIYSNKLRPGTQGKEGLAASCCFFFYLEKNMDQVHERAPADDEPVSLIPGTEKVPRKLAVTGFSPHRTPRAGPAVPTPPTDLARWSTNGRLQSIDAAASRSRLTCSARGPAGTRGARRVGRPVVPLGRWV